MVNGCSSETGTVVEAGDSSGGQHRSSVTEGPKGMMLQCIGQRNAVHLFCRPLQHRNISGLISADAMHV